jgi:DNA mismatch repair protein MutL
VSSKLVWQAVYKAYQQYRSKDRFPAIFLFLQLPPDSFDVNIHPQKRDIKFRDENEIFTFIYDKISRALLGSSQSENMPLKTPAPSLPPDTGEITPNRPQGKDARAGLDFALRDGAQIKYYSPVPAPRPLSPAPLSCPPSRQEALPPQSDPQLPLSGNTESFASREQAVQPAWWKGPYNYLGQIHRIYLAFENGEGLVIVDQHAAQERVLFEEYLGALENGSVKIQSLMFPVNIELPASDIEAVLQWEKFLVESGFEVSRFSARMILVSSTPASLKMDDQSIRSFITQFACVIGNPEKSSQELKHKLIATMACKKAVKAGEKLEVKQACALMENLKCCKDGLHCPHGRPTLISIDIKDLSRKFGRS